MEVVVEVVMVKVVVHEFGLSGIYHPQEWPTQNYWHFDLNVRDVEITEWDVLGIWGTNL